jgi:hypothetical protein
MITDTNKKGQTRGHKPKITVDNTNQSIPESGTLIHNIGTEVDPVRLYGDLALHAKNHGKHMATYFRGARQDECPPQIGDVEPPCDTSCGEDEGYKYGK